MPGMDWYLWLIAVAFAYGAVATVATVGKPRKPIEPSVAAVIVVIDAALIIGLLVTR